jgi:hypothetical protein
MIRRALTNLPDTALTPAPAGPTAQEIDRARRVWTAPRGHSIATRRRAARILAESGDRDHAAAAETFLAATRQPLVARFPERTETCPT